MYNKIKRIHFIGIGGIGMSGIAELLSSHGYLVSGSDQSASETVRRLEGLGIRIQLGHDAKHAEGAELVVYSSAVRPENPELVTAKAKGIPAIPRAEMLAELMRIKHGIAVAGAHGKTTTTSMIATILTEADLDPTIVVGGRMDNFGGTNARLGRGEFMVVEADESDGSFNRLSPSIAIVTNIDREHMDYYRTMRRLQRSFLSFLNKVPFYGLSLLYGDDPYLRLLSHRVDRRKETFGEGEQNTYRVLRYASSPEGSDSLVSIKGAEERVRLRVPGKHNLLNALAALAVADELSVPRAKSLAALRAFQGVQRRFQRRGAIDGVTFVDDYAHHPTEIRATLTAARERFPNAKIRAIFQPHRFSRVADLFHEFATAFSECEAVALLPIYAAGEAALPGVDSAGLAEAMRRSGMGNVALAAKPMDAVEKWLGESVEGDVVLTLGAGDLPNVYRQLF